MSVFKDYNNLKDLEEDFDLSIEFEKITGNEPLMDGDERSSYLSIDVLSDTHTLHNQVDTSDLNGDILIFAGDFLKKCGTRIIVQEKIKKMKSFNHWIGKLEHKLKFVICGNHDEIDVLKVHEIEEHLSNAIYLQNSGYDLEVKKFFPSKKASAENEVVKLYGSPSNVYRENYWKPFSCMDIKKNWDEIPIDTNILITHLPPFTILDLAACKPFNREKSECKDCGKAHYGFRHTGCKHLKERVEELSTKGRLRMFVFGHSHDRYGAYKSKKNGLLYVNPSILNRNFEVVKKPMKLFYSLK